MTSFKYKSYAKLNLSLYVGPPNSEGYHPLRSHFCSIDYCDDIIIESSLTGAHDVIFEGSDVPLSNTCTKVFELMSSYLKQHWKVTVNKSIPSGAGLGGGSSNAAVLCRALSDIENLNLSLKELTEQCVLIGSDVPYFLHGGFCDVSGIGDVVTPLEDKPTMYFVLIFPNEHCSTGDVYRHLDLLGVFDDLSSINRRKLMQYGYNRLKLPVYDLFPSIKQLSLEIESLVSQPVYLSGSGSTLFLLTDNIKQQERVFCQLANALNCKVVCAKSINGTEGRT